MNKGPRRQTRSPSPTRVLRRVDSDAKAGSHFQLSLLIKSVAFLLLTSGRWLCQYFLGHRVVVQILYQILARISVAGLIPVPIVDHLDGDTMSLLLTIEIVRHPWDTRHTGV